MKRARARPVDRGGLSAGPIPPWLLRLRRATVTPDGRLGSDRRGPCSSVRSLRRKLSDAAVDIKELLPIAAYQETLNRPKIGQRPAARQLSEAVEAGMPVPPAELQPYACEI